MLLTITTTHQPATDLGYLLHKNPAKLHSFELSFGKAHVFYPEAATESCTAALLLDVDPVALVRGRRGQHDGGTLDQYVNDRPYVLSSFLSVAMGRAFGTAVSGRSKGRPELADQAISLTARLAIVACRAGEGLIRELFTPLGYSVTAVRHPLDEKFSEWGEGPYYSVLLAGVVRLQDLLNHLYVLVPVLDAEKHYWIGKDEVEKLLRKGKGWLASHPHKEAIVKRYLPRQRQLAREALARLTEEDNPDPDATEEAHAEEEIKMEEPIRLWQQRMGAVVAVLRAAGAKRVLDLGCGEGKLLRALLEEKSLTEIVGMDVSYRSLGVASQRLELDRMPTKQKERLKLMHGSLMYRDKRLGGYDAATVVEVIEHLDAPRLAVFERVLFEAARPKTIVVTTPNAEYNVKFDTLPAGQFRQLCNSISGGWRGRPSSGRTDTNGSFQSVNITIPELSLVVLIGPSGCGKSSFARAHFKPTEVLSSDFCRGLVSDDENAQAATNDAFDVLHYVARKRLAAGRLTVVDATNVQPEARKPLVALARELHVLPVAIVLNLPERLCHERNQSRPDRQFGPHVVRNQSHQVRRPIRGLEREGFRHVFVLSTPDEVASVTITRQPLWNNLKHEHGPFDIIGDVHGCYEELNSLLEQLGYQIEHGPAGPKAIPPDGRRAVFVGDLVDRGPKIPEVLRLVMRMVEAGTAFCVPGNHDMKLMRKLKGRDVQLTHGLADSIEQLDRESPQFKQQVVKFLDDQVSHYVFDDGKLVVAHAGMKEEMQGRGSGKVRDFALYGETTGETDEYGLPVRYNWAAEYRGKAMVVYGHTPVAEPEWLNRTINIDTGCVFGGKLTALRYPERELVSAPALRIYYKSAKPFSSKETTAPALTAQQQLDDLLDIEDVLGKRIITTRLH